MWGRHSFIFDADSCDISHRDWLVREGRTTKQVLASKSNTIASLAFPTHLWWETSAAFPWGPVWHDVHLILIEYMFMVKLFDPADEQCPWMLLLDRGAHSVSSHCPG